MVTEIHFEPTLFIFLGTSAGQIGWRLKSLLHKAYGDIAVHRFLWIDSDGTIDPTAAEWFDPLTERAELAGFDGDAVIASLDAYPHIKAFWPKNSQLKPGFIERGARQIRLYGRLSLFRMFNERSEGLAFIDKLKKSVESIQQINNADITESMSSGDKRYVVDRGSSRVVIVFSTCGGTGSSMAYDLAYLSRDLLKGNRPTIIGISMLPSVIDQAIKNETQTQREKIRANTYAWFKENDYLISNPHWNMTYPEGGPIDVYGPPFNLNFVVGISNQAGDRLNSADDIFTLIAQAVFLDTGSSIGGAISGFNVNVSVLGLKFQERFRSYSSIATAALIYPVDKILIYCGAQLSIKMIDDGFFADPKEDEVLDSAAALIGRLRLRDNQLLLDLLAERFISDSNVPAIRKASTVEKIRGLLTAQEADDNEGRSRQLEQISFTAESMLREDLIDLEREIAEITLKQGGAFAEALLETLASDPKNQTKSSDDTSSLTGCKTRVNRHGVTNEDISRAEDEYREARLRLRKLEGDPKMAVLALLAKKRWQRTVDGARNDCLHWMAEVNQLILQLGAQNEAINSYDQLITLVRKLKGSTAGVVQRFNQAKESLDQIADSCLEPGTSEEHIYELALEAIDSEYIRNYYTKQVANLDTATAYHSFAETIETEHQAKLFTWDKNEISNGLQKHAQDYFNDKLKQTSLLDALEAYHQNQAGDVIEKQFDRLVRHCHPFWRYDRDRGLHGLEGISIIGVEEEHSPLIPTAYRDHAQYEIKSTGFKHEIYASRVLHGLPAFLLQNMDEYKAYYDENRKGVDPLHVIPEAAFANEVIPEEKQEARSIFAVATAFGYVVQIGPWYYFDPEKRYSIDNIHPGRENQLSQGRINAENEFIHHEDWVRQSSNFIQEEISRVGNDSAISLLEERISTLKQTLKKMSIDNELRPQVEKEIHALQEKQAQLDQI